MNDELILSFKEYVDEFKKLEIKDKRMEIIESVKEITALVDSLAQRENKSLEFLKSKEITELNKGEESEADFLEALLVYVENAKNLLGQYLDDKI